MAKRYPLLGALLGLSLIVLVLSACATKTARIEGRIFRSDLNQPIVGATLSLIDYELPSHSVKEVASTITDSNGEFSFDVSVKPSHFFMVKAILNFTEDSDEPRFPPVEQDGWQVLRSLKPSGQTVIELRWPFDAPGMYLKPGEVVRKEIDLNCGWCAKRIAFESNRDGDFDIYLMNADGSNLTQLTDDPAADGYPDWSPDGRDIAFTSTRNGTDSIFVMESDGSNITQITPDSFPGWFPVWSPDGNKIAFLSDKAGNVDIYVMNSDGSNILQLTSNPAPDNFPSWSPDGKRIVFSSGGEDQTDIYVIDASSGNLVQLTKNAALNWSPAWSPDGSRIAFASSREGDSSIYLMDVDGENVDQLTYSTSSSPEWSSDGSLIVFVGPDSRGDPLFNDIKIKNIEGMFVLTLTDNPTEDNNPSWQP